MKKIVLLDLEETLIPIWGEWWPLNHCDTIRLFLNQWKPDEVVTFSWAIWGQEDVETFNKVRHRVEDQIGWKFTKVQSIDDIRHDLKKANKFANLSREDFFDFFCRKESAIFSLAMNGFWENSEIILFDDSVEGMVLTIPKFNVKINIINVNEGKIND